MRTAAVRPDAVAERPAAPGPARRRSRSGEARQAAARVIGAWAAERCPEATGEELERLVREVVQAVGRAMTPRMVPPAHSGLTSKPGADAEAARRIAARLEAELRPAAPRRTAPYAPAAAVPQQRRLLLPPPRPHR